MAFNPDRAIDAPLSANTKAILLLTAPLLLGKGGEGPKLLSLGEYNRLAQFLRERNAEPADLLSPNAHELVQAASALVEPVRLEALLERGFLLSQVAEQWQSRAIWVASRADSSYPRRLKSKLREHAPAVIYGAGASHLLDEGGLAVVGSRDVDDVLIQFTRSVGAVAASASRSIVSGGAKGIDQAAMDAALEAGGTVCGVLSDSLEKHALKRDYRDALLQGSLVLVSPFDPRSGFLVGHAMQRNKLIYALADAALVVNAAYNEGGTWAGAVEQLDKLRCVPIFVRSSGASNKALDALRVKGAQPWPDPDTSDSLRALLQAAVDRSGPGPRDTPSLFDRPLAESAERPSIVREPAVGLQATAREIGMASGNDHRGALIEDVTASPAEHLFETVKSVALMALREPISEAEFASMLDVTKSQARVWLDRLVSEGLVEKVARPSRYRLTATPR